MPEAIKNYFDMTLLGAPVAFYDQKNHKIIRGYRWKGKIYLEGKPDGDN